MPTAVSRGASGLTGRDHAAGPHSTEVGTTTLLTVDGTPVERVVRLHEQASGRAVRQTLSARATGQWQFQSLAAGVYYVVAFDHTGVYAGVVETDIVLPTPGGGA